MAEARAIIKDIEKAKRTLEKLGAESQGSYSFTDTIFAPKSNNFNLNNETLRLRSIKKSNHETKPFVLVQKKYELKNGIQKDKTLLRKEFNTENEALGFIHTYFKFNPLFEYYRDGEEFHLGKARIFIEDIKDFKPCVEVEAKDEKDIEEIFLKLNIAERLTETLPETMRKIILN